MWIPCRKSVRSTTASLHIATTVYRPTHTERDEIIFPVGVNLVEAPFLVAV